MPSPLIPTNRVLGRDGLASDETVETYTLFDGRLMVDRWGSHEEVDPVATVACLETWAERAEQLVDGSGASARRATAMRQTIAAIRAAFADKFATEAKGG